MSGHNKWSKIVHKKEKTDANKAKTFTKFYREILLSMKIGGTDENLNFRLKNIMRLAKIANVPKQIFINAKNSYENKSEEGNDKIYECYGTNGVAMLIKGSTDNVNRTTAHVKYFINRIGGNLGGTMYLFEKVSILSIQNITEEEVLLKLIDVVGVEEVIEYKNDNNINIVDIKIDCKELNSVIKVFEGKDYEYDILFLPLQTISVSEELMISIQKNIDDFFNKCDSISSIYTNIIGFPVIENND
jgi:YebC/PmpR family DNA-binding regulatory protein